MADRRKNIKVFTTICLITLLASCAQKTQPAPTPDIDALATQMWIEQSVQQTLEASIPTTTSLPTATPVLTTTPTYLSTPISAPANLDNYPPFYNPVNNMELAYVPEGKFLMGSNPYDHYLGQSELPQHSVYLDAFWISKTQVTNAMFTSCVNAGVCKYSVSHKINPHYLDPLYNNHPVVYVSWKIA